MRLLAAAVMLALFLPFFAVTPAGAGIVDNGDGTEDLTEDFEDDDVLEKPSDDWFNFVSVGTGNFNVQSGTKFAGAKAYEQSGLTAVSSMGRYNLAGGRDFCDADKVKVQYRVNSLSRHPAIWLSDTTDGSRVSDQSGAGNNGFGFYVDQSTITIRALANTDTGVAEVSMGSVNINTWYELEFRDINCAAGKFRAVSITHGTAIDVDAAGSLSQLVSFKVGQQGSETQSYANDQFIDDLIVEGMPAPSGPGTPVVGSAATVAVTGLVGFDVDHTGSTVIARTNAGEFIRTYEPTTLTEIASEDTNCGQEGGVVAGTGEVLYLACVLVSEPNTVKFRTPALGTPTLPSECPNNADPTWGDSTDFQDTLLMRSFKGIGISLAPVALCAFQFPLAYTSANGGVGLLVLTAVDPPGAAPFVTGHSFRERTYHDANGANSICATFGEIDGDAAQESSFSATKNAHPTHNYRLAESGDVDFALFTAFSGLLTSAEGIACTQTEHRYVAQETNVHRISARTGTQTWQSAPGFSVVPNGIDASYDDKFVVAVGAGSGAVLSASNGSVLGTFTPPAGTLKAVRIDGTGQHIWVATDSNIAVYNVVSITTGTPTPPPIEVGVPSAPPVLPGEGILDDSNSQIAEALGISSTAGGMILALLVVSALAAAGAAGLREAPLIGAAGGALGGIVFSWVFGFLDAVVIFVLVLIGAGFVAMRLFNRGEAAP